MEGMDTNKTKTPKMYMAIDQYGQTFHSLTHPRKELCERIGCKHVNVMYCDTLSGETRKLGYVIAGHWLTVYEVIPANMGARS